MPQIDPIRPLISPVVAMIDAVNALAKKTLGGGRKGGSGTAQQIAEVLLNTTTEAD